MKTNNGTNKTVYVGLSGGVDSSLSAALLKNEGYNVVGVYMKNWSGDNYGIQTDCPWEDDVEDVKAVCKQLNIPFKSYNFEREYRQDVVDYFFREYEAGRTPNPDVLCNKEIKFKRFLDRALADGADMIATGHYAQVRKISDKYELLRGVDPNKDQTYFLHTFTQAQLSRVLFPVGEMMKPEVRKLAEKFSLPTAQKKDSQGICFIGNIDVQDFLRQKIDTKPGNIVDVDTNEVVGKHDGVMFYTIGQRKGIGIGGAGAPYFVIGKNKEKNELLVGKGANHPMLYYTKVKLENIHWISGETPKLPLDCEVSIRYRQKAQKATLVILNENQSIQIEFENPVRAVSPGQSAVIYQGDICLGGGIIKQ